MIHAILRMTEKKKKYAAFDGPRGYKECFDLRPSGDKRPFFQKDVNIDLADRIEEEIKVAAQCLREKGYVRPGHYLLTPSYPWGQPRSAKRRWQLPYVRVYSEDEQGQRLVYPMNEAADWEMTFAGMLAATSNATRIARLTFRRAD